MELFIKTNVAKGFNSCVKLIPFPIGGQEKMIAADDLINVLMPKNTSNSIGLNMRLMVRSFSESEATL